jgi:hypothetical protein
VLSNLSRGNKAHDLLWLELSVSVTMPHTDQFLMEEWAS